MSLFFFSINATKKISLLLHVYIVLKCSTLFILLVDSCTNLYIGIYYVTGLLYIIFPTNPKTISYVVPDDIWNILFIIIFESTKPSYCEKIHNVANCRILNCIAVTRRFRYTMDRIATLKVILIGGLATSPISSE